MWIKTFFNALTEGCSARASHLLPLREAECPSSFWVLQVLHMAPILREVDFRYVPQSLC